MTSAARTGTATAGGGPTADDDARRTPRNDGARADDAGAGAEQTPKTDGPGNGARHPLSTDDLPAEAGHTTRNGDARANDADTGDEQAPGTDAPGNGARHPLSTDDLPAEAGHTTRNDDARADDAGSGAGQAPGAGPASGTHAPGAGNGGVGAATRRTAAAGGAISRIPEAAEGGRMGWQELVGVAMVGAERRAAGVGALLDAAAVETVRRRAGLVPTAARALPAPVERDPRPALPVTARWRLAAPLAARPATAGGNRRGPTPDLAELLPEWLRLAGERGYQAPPQLLPGLLDAARARTDLRAQVLAFAGQRGLWLAERAPRWASLLRDGAAGPALPDPADHDAVRTLWEKGPPAGGPGAAGTGQVRAALLARARRADPGAALELLAATWATEKAEDRLTFVELLRTGLSLADEEFLEHALGDRSRSVRATAAELLAALPGSALAGRMAHRVRSLVVLDRSESPPVIAAEAPYECDAAMQRDGILPRPPAGVGERSWWFGQLVAATPLTVWTEVFDGRTPAEIVALPVADGWRPDLLAAWCRAAARQHDAAWARALLGAAPPQVTGGPGEHAPGRDPARLLTALPEDERAAWVAEFIAGHGLSEAFRLLGACAVPWPEELGRAVVDALEIARDGGSYPWSFSGVMGLAERCLDPSYAARLEPLAALREEPEESSPGADGYWAEAFQRLAATLHVRAEMRDELTTPQRLRPGGSPDRVP